MGKGMTIGIIVLVLIVVGFFLFSGAGDNEGSDVGGSGNDVLPPAGSESSGLGDDDSSNADDGAGDDDSPNVGGALVGSRVVSVTPSGFSPSNIEIGRGETVTFVNQGGRTHWPASDVHPSHSAYPGSSKAKCSTAERDSIFDACKPLNGGERWSFTFDNVGTWRYHDHLSPGLKGSVTVR